MKVPIITDVEPTKPCPNMDFVYEEFKVTDTHYVQVVWNIVFQYWLVYMSSEPYEVMRSRGVGRTTNLRRWGMITDPIAVQAILYEAFGLATPSEESNP